MTLHALHVKAGEPVMFRWGSHVSLLAILCALSEVLFCRAVAHRYGVRPAALVLVFSGASSGMFHAGVALLPSTTCMYCVLLGYAAWFSGRQVK